MSIIKYVLIICLIALSKITYCQGADSLSFIYSQIARELKEGQKLIYTDRITSFAYQQAKEDINKQFFEGMKGGEKKTAFRFTEKEQQTILQELELCTKPFWSDSLFDNSTMIRLDSFWQHYRTIWNARRKISRLIDTPGYSQEFRAAIIKELQKKEWVFFFSKPIYLRHNTLAVLYLEPRCGWDCGYNELAVYRKFNEKWEKWISIFQGNY